jgi:tetratricopeptide (TPR) repeat protein
MKLKFASYILLLLCFTAEVFADPTGRIRGTVKDDQGKPIDKVNVAIESRSGITQKYKTTTNSKGEYIHIGIKPGDYRVTPSKEGYVPVQYAYIDLHISAADKPEVADFVMRSQQQQQQSGKEPSAQKINLAEAQQGIALLNQGKTAEAIVLLKKAVEANAGNAILHHDLAVAYEKNNQVEEAKAQYQEAIKLKPDLGAAYLALGNLYLSEKNFENAATSLKKASELLPQSYEAFYNLGAAYSNTMKYAEAEAAYKQAAQIKPQEPIVHYQLGMAL